MDVIQSFRDAETEKVWKQQFSRRLSGIAKPALRKLIHLDRAASLNDLAAIPGDRLESLAGDRKNQYTASGLTINIESVLFGVKQTPAS